MGMENGVPPPPHSHAMTAENHDARFHLEHDAIAVIDFGGQYAHLIATKVRRMGVLAEIRQPEDPIEAFHGFKGIIISGSPSLASQGEDSDYTREIYDLDTPILGFCFGHQEIAKHYGGEVIHGGREWGHSDLQLTGDHPLFKGLGPVETVWMSHYDSVVALGPTFKELGYTEGTKDSPAHRYAAIGSDQLRRYGFQFHAEVDDTVHGDAMIANFVFEICGCEATWSMEAFLEEEIRKVQRQVGEGSVFLLASGGVDSTVAAAVLGKALGPERVHLLHVDNGMMRKNESAAVLDLFTDLGLDEHLHFVDASETFLTALSGVVEPEAKRRIIGDTFIRVFEEKARELGIQHHLLGQGTIYPDTVETGGTKRADTIKTHHNRVQVIEEMIQAGRVVEPLAELYKVEVRELGESLGIPHRALWRHPFPGPGLGVRLLCGTGEPDRAHFDTLEEALPDVAMRFDGVQALALPIRSVGVKADLRAYEHPVLITADVGWDPLIRAVSAITANVPHVNRCVWNLGMVDAQGIQHVEHPGSARPLPGYMTRGRLDVLREADAIVMEALERHGLYDEIWQCPTVMVPLELEGSLGEMIVLRPVRSQRAMTATPVHLPLGLLREVRDRILPLPGVGSLTLDLTSKPPGTIEWE
jgi:GMP synthase (glutamine-hydrolysing)